MLERASEHILYCLILGFLDGRGYHIPVRNCHTNEEEERERLNAQSLSQERERNKYVFITCFCLLNNFVLIL